MGVSASKPSLEELETLRQQLDVCCREVALAIRKAEVLVLCCGAGLSADSGLPTYSEIAKVKVYQDLGFKYDDICRPSWITHDPEIFYGFWGSCFNDYRETQPHEGYGILRAWRDSKINGRVSKQIRMHLEEEMAAIPSEKRQPEPYEVQGQAGGFFLYTSNVDGHCYDHFEACELRECHGNTEAAKPFGPRKTPLAQLPEESRPEVLAQVEHSFRRRDENWPICPWCKSLARPHVLMFNDTHMVSDMEQELRFQRWKDVVLDVCKQSRVSRNKMTRVTVLEIGCGGRVPTVRSVSEALATSFRKHAEVTIARINPEFPLPDRLHPPSMYSRYLCLPVKGLEGLRKISEHYDALARPSQRPLKERSRSRSPPPVKSAAVAPKPKAARRSTRAGTAKGPPGVIKTLD